MDTVCYTDHFRRRRKKNISRQIGIYLNRAQISQIEQWIP